MRKSIATLLLMILFFATISKGAEDYSYLKIAVDGMAVNNALFALSNTGKQEKEGIYHAKIDQLLDDLGTHNTGFRKDLFPVELVLKSENEAHVKMICAKLAKLLAEVRTYANAAEEQFDLDDLPLIMMLKSENPGDYYIGINPDFVYTFANHPFRKSIEELQLQDIGFVDVLASSDTSLWNMASHCPNLKILTLFAAEIDDKILAQLNLDRISNLKSLELSELPKNLSNWTNLKYLHLGSNQFDSTERLRIQKALPTTKIMF